MASSPLQQVCAGAVNSGAGDITKPLCNPLLINEDRTRPPRTLYCEAHWERVKVKVPVYRMGLCKDCFAGYEIGSTRRQESTVRRRDYEPKLCGYRNCGKEFSPVHPRQIYCNLTCNRKEWSARVSEGVEALRLRSCVACGAEFMPICAPQLTCSTDCSKEHERRQNRNRKRDRRGIVRL